MPSPINYLLNFHIYSYIQNSQIDHNLGDFLNSFRGYTRWNITYLAWRLFAECGKNSRLDARCRSDEE